MAEKPQDERRFQAERDPTRIASRDMTPEDVRAHAALADQPPANGWTPELAARYAEEEDRVRNDAERAAASPAQASALIDQAVAGFRARKIREANGEDVTADLTYTETVTGGAYKHPQGHWMNAEGVRIAEPPQRPERPPTAEERAVHGPTQPGQRPQADAQPASTRR